MRRLGTLAALAAAAGLVYLLFAGNPSPVPMGTAKAAPLSGPLLGGGRAALADFAGKVVLVDFWATWCDPCVEEVPGLAALHAKLSAKGFAVLGVSMDEEGEGAVKGFMKDHPIPYPVILNGGERAPAGWLTPGFPTAYLIGRDGTVLKRWLGSKDLAEIERDVQAALAR